MILVDKSYWLLQDILTGSEKRPQIEQSFRFDDGAEVRLDGRSAIATAPKGEKLVIVPLSGDFDPHIRVAAPPPPRTYWPSNGGTGGRSETYGSPRHGWQKQPPPGLAVTYIGKPQLPVVLTVATASSGAKLVLLPLSGELRPHLTIADRTPHTTCWPLGEPTQQSPG